MSYKDGQVEFTLSTPLRYSEAGDPNLQAKFLLMREPKAGHAKHYFKIRQMINRACMDVAQSMKNFKKLVDEEQDGLDLPAPEESEEQEEQEETPEMFGEEIKPELEKSEEEIKKEDDDTLSLVRTAIEMSEKIDLSVFMNEFRKMATVKNENPILLIEGRVRMTDAYFNRIPLDEQIAIACEWCAFFAGALNFLTK